MSDCLLNWLLLCSVRLTFNCSPCSCSLASNCCSWTSQLFTLFTCYSLAAAWPPTVQLQQLGLWLLTLFNCYSWASNCSPYSYNLTSKLLQLLQLSSQQVTLFTCCSRASQLVTLLNSSPAPTEPLNWPPCSPAAAVPLNWSPCPTAHPVPIAWPPTAHPFVSTDDTANTSYNVTAYKSSTLI